MKQEAKSKQATEYNFAIMTSVAALAQLVERIFRKDEVRGSTPRGGSIYAPTRVSYNGYYVSIILRIYWRAGLVQW